MKRILVTGASGYIGAHVVRALADRGVDVIAVDRPNGRARTVDPRATAVEADIFADPAALMEDVGPVDVCLHLAWEAGFVHNSPTHMLRLSDHVRFLEAVVAAGTPQLAALGSMHEVGYHHGVIDENTPTEPRSLYGIAKNALRQALEVRFGSTELTLQWLRCFYIYGDDARNSSIFTKISQAAVAGATSFPFTSGLNKYDFIDVHELANQISATVMQSTITGVINCCSGEPVSLAERVEAFIAERGYQIELEYGAFPDRAYDSPAVWGDPSKIRAILELTADRPTDAHEGSFRTTSTP